MPEVVNVCLTHYKDVVMKLKWSLLPRYSVFLLCIIGALICLPLAMQNAWLWPLASVFVLLVAVGLNDLRQSDYAVRRNYPVIGNMRYLFKALRPEMRQYLFESDTDQLPFSHKQRELVYARGRQRNSSQPFGTLLDVYSDSYEFIGHSMQTSSMPDPRGFRLNIGNSQCSHPYNASLFNISAMSFGSLSANAIRALNKGARLGNFAHDTGEGSISPYHREFAGDLIWELGSGYFGCRDEDGASTPNSLPVRRPASRSR